VLLRVKAGSCGKPGKERIRLLDSYPEVLNAALKTLNGLRKTSMAINTSLARNVILGNIEALNPRILQQPHNGYIPVLSLSSVRRYLNKELNWSFRAATKASQKIPDDWEDQCEMTFFRLVYTIATSDIHPSLVINADQTMIHLVPGGNQRTYDEKGCKQVSLHGLDEKRGFTSLVAITVAGTVLGTQSIWCGMTAASIPTLKACVDAEQSGHIISWNPNSHWSSLTSMQEFYEKIISPHRQQMIKQHNLPDSAKSIIYFDCWQVHRSADMLSWLKDTYTWLIVIFVPAGCTGIFQPCDVGLQRVYKQHIRLAASNYFISMVRSQIEEGVCPEEVKLSTALPPLRDATAAWVLHSINHLNEPAQQSIRNKSWSNCQVKNWNISWECLSSATARAAFMGKSLSFEQNVKGNFTSPQTEIFEEEDNVVEDEADVPLEVIHIAACVSPLSALNPAIQSLNNSTNTSVYLEENYLDTIPRGYHRSLRARAPIGYEESDTESEEELGDDAQEENKYRLSAQKQDAEESKTGNVEIWQRLRSAARTGGVQGGIVGKRAA